MSNPSQAREALEALGWSRHDAEISSYDRGIFRVLEALVSELEELRRVIAEPVPEVDPVYEVAVAEARVPAIGSRVWGDVGVFFPLTDAYGTVRGTSYDPEQDETLVRVELSASGELVWVPASKVLVQP